MNFHGVDIKNLSLDGLKLLKITTETALASCTEELSRIELQAELHAINELMIIKENTMKHTPEQLEKLVNTLPLELTDKAYEVIEQMINDFNRGFEKANNGNMEVFTMDDEE